jgi:erythromycin esterase
MRLLVGVFAAVLVLGLARVPALGEPVAVRTFDTFGFSNGEYVVRIDPAMTYAGAAVLSLRGAGGGANAFGANGWRIALDAYRGKRARLSAAVKTAGVETNASIWLRVDGPTTMFDNMMPGRGLTGTHDWTKLTVVLDVPADATAIVGGALLIAPHGQMWVADPRIDIVPASVALTGGAIGGDETAPPVPTAPHLLDAAQRAAALAALRAAEAPLTTVDPGAVRSDLAPFERAVGDARIVGLGEASHGTSEFFSMKDRLFRDLVEKKGFTVFAIEANEPEAREMERYVTTGAGDPAHALASMYFWTWRTREVLELAKWMRAYNAAAGRHRTLHFAGFDMQEPSVAVASVTAFANERDPSRAAAIAADYACIPPAAKREATSAAEWDGCATSVARASARIAALHPGLDVAHDARIVEQFVATRRFTNRGSERDRFMAENVEWLAGSAYRGAKIALWAHNYHISDMSQGGVSTMGSYLYARYGAQYYRLGFAFDRGSIRAFQGGEGVGPRDVAPALADSVEGLLREAGARYFLDLDGLPASSLRAWLDGGTLEREIGALYSAKTDNGFYLTVNLRERFDGLIFIEQSHAAVAL